MAKLLNVELVIEGVETASQLETLTSWSVHLIQGYYYSRPQPLADLMPMLKGSSGGAARPRQKAALKDVA